MLRRHGALLRTAIVLAALAGWFVWLRPVSLGGPASYIFVSGASMQPIFNLGDLVVTQRADSYANGDIVMYRVPAGEAASGMNVIHRIIGGDGASGYTMRGDNTDGPDLWRPTQADVVGRTWFYVPGLANVLLIARSPLMLASMAGALVVAAILFPRRRRTSAATAEGL